MGKGPARVNLSTGAEKRGYLYGETTLCHLTQCSHAIMSITVKGVIDFYKESVGHGVLCSNDLEAR